MVATMRRGWTLTGPLPIYSGQQLEELPPPAWLIDGVLIAGSFAMLVGPKESYKSFIALDIALSVASGTDWQGRTVTRGPVLYLATEAGATLRNRHMAWRLARGCQDTRGCWFMLERLNLRQCGEGGDVGRVLATIEAMADYKAEDGSSAGRPKLVVIDTLNKAFGGGDENSSEDMGAFLAACDTIRQETEAAVLVVHHPGWLGERSRGHSSLPAAIDTEITAARKGDAVTLACTKMRMGPDFEPIKLAARAVELGDGRQSLVLDLAGTACGRQQRRDVPDPDYDRALRFAKLAKGLGTPSLEEMAEAQGLSADTIKRYAQKVEAEYSLVKLAKVQEGRTWKWRIFPRG